MPSGLRGGGTLGPRPRTTPNHRTLVSHLGQLRQSPVISLDTQLPLPSRKYLSCRSLDVGTFDAAQNGPHDERGWLGTTRSCQERQAMTESQAVLRDSDRATLRLRADVISRLIVAQQRTPTDARRRPCARQLLERANQ